MPESHIRRQSLAGVIGERDTILQSTTWKATWVVRAAGTQLPTRLRRALRGGAKILWWTVTFKLPRVLTDA